MGDQDLVCQLENIQGFLDALNSIRWKGKQDALVELTEHGLLVTAQELNCLQARAYFRKELFVAFSYSADTRQRFGVSLSLLIDTVNTFLSAAASSLSWPVAPLSPVLTLSYPGPDMELLLKMSILDHVAIGAELRTLLPSWSPEEFALQEQRPNTPQNSSVAPPVSFVIKTSLLKELMEDLEWPGSDVSIMVQPQPAGVSFLAQGHGDLQIDLPFGSNDLFMDFQCSRSVSYRYKYKYLSAVISGMPTAALKESGGSKFTIDSLGLLKVQHLVNVRQTLGGFGASSTHRVPAAAFSQLAFATQDGLWQRPSGVGTRASSYVEFFVTPSEELNEGNMDD